MDQNFTPHHIRRSAVPGRKKMDVPATNNTPYTPGNTLITSILNYSKSLVAFPSHAAGNILVILN